MATASEIQSLLDRLNSTYQKLGEQNPFANFDINTISDAVSEAKRLEDALTGAGERLRNMSSDLDGIVGALKAQVVELNKGNNLITTTRRQFTGLASLAVKLRDDQEGINRLSAKELVSIKAKIASKREELKDNQSLLANKINQLQQEGASQDIIDKHIDSLGIVNNELLVGQGITEDLLNLTQKRIEAEERINESLGLTGALLKGAEGFMNKIGLGALSSAMGFGDINKELKEFAEELDNGDETLTDFEKKQRVMAQGFKLTGASLKNSLTDPLAVLSLSLKGLSFISGKIADGFNRSQEVTGNIAKNLSITNGEAMGITKGMTLASFGSDKLFVSSKGLSETLVAINSSLGTSVILSNDQLSTFTKLRETAGLTNEELMGVEKLSLANGDSFDENANSLLNQVASLNKSSGIYINQKDVLKEVSKLSAATTLSLGKTPKALAEAITVAKSLGMEMSQVDAIASSLLDFETSIGDELSAELLLNKDLNLEKARQAALNNDLATVASEIAKQAGSAAEFGEMNRIQQEALAKAVGMSREDLAKTLFTQEALVGASGKEAERREKLLNARIAEVGLAQAQKEAAEGGLDAMLDQATASEKMQASMGKIDELFTSIGSMFAPLVNMFASVAGFIMQSKVGLVLMSTVLAGVVTLLGVMAVKAAAVAVAQLFAGVAKFGPLAIPLGIAAIGALIGGITAVVATVGDINSPASGKTQISTKEGGLFELSKNDDVVAFPGASKMMNGGYGGGTTVVQQDNSETNNLLKQLISTNQQGNGLLSKKQELSPVGLYEIQ